MLSTAKKMLVTGQGTRKLCLLNIATFALHELTNFIQKFLVLRTFILCLRCIIIMKFAIQKRIFTPIKEMEEWLQISLLLCIYGVIKEFRPLEPFVTNYLINPPMNFTHEQVSYSIYPVSIYSSMILLIFIFLLTDMVRYKPIIILYSISGVIYTLMLTVCRNLFLIQVMEVFYGLFMACEVAYYTYIYAKVDKEHYQAVSSYTRAAYLVGRSISGIASQILVSAGFSYYSLNFFTLGGMVTSLFWAFMLPTVSSSIYFNPSSVAITNNIEQTPSHSENQNICTSIEKLKKSKARSEARWRYVRGFKLLFIDFKKAFTNIYLLKWLVWWSIATCAYYQTLAYIQLLWAEIVQENDTEYYNKLNGVVETMYTLLSALGAFLCGKLTLEWSIYGEFALFLCSIGLAITLMLMARTNYIIVAYIAYIIYAVIYNSMITIANSEIAKHISADSYGLIFGLIFFIALTLQSIITVIMVNVLNLTAQKQFEVCSFYFCFLAIVFIIKTLHQFIRHYRSR